MTKKEQLINILREEAKRALNRGEKHVSNIALNKILQTYKLKGFTNLNDILEDFATIKADKSIDGLCDNIMAGLRAGTRTDGVAVDLEDFDF